MNLYERLYLAPFPRYYHAYSARDVTLRCPSVSTRQFKGAMQRFFTKLMKSSF